MSGIGTWRFSLRCTSFRRDRSTADIDRSPAPIASEAYDPGRAARRERNDHGQRLAGIILGGRRPAEGEQDGKNSGGQSRKHILSSLELAQKAQLSGPAQTITRRHPYRFCGGHPQFALRVRRARWKKLARLLRTKQQLAWLGNAADMCSIDPG